MDLLLEFLPGFLTLIVAVFLSILLRRPFSKDLQKALLNFLLSVAPKEEEAPAPEPVEKIIDVQKKVVFNGSEAELLKSYTALVDSLDILPDPQRREVFEAFLEKMVKRKSEEDNYGD